MKTRNSKIFGDLEESAHSNKLEIITKFPEKWILIDTENSRIYKGTKNKKITTMWKEIVDYQILKKIQNIILDKIKY
jgi:hypothetical protein